MCKWGNWTFLKPHDRRLIPNRVRNDWVKVDSCLAEAVTLLWYFGYPTLGCCCAHGKGHGSIEVASSSIFSGGFLGQTNLAKATAFIAKSINPYPRD